jgi:perosamine synthetase
VLTCGEGGAVATDNDYLADKLKMIRNHGMVEGYDTRILGLNLRLPELSAAIAKVQMSKLPKMLDLRRSNAELLTRLLLPIVEESKIRLPEETNEKKFNWYLYTAAFENNGQRDQIKERMINDKIGATVYYSPPVHKTPYYDTLVSLTKGNDLSNTDWASEHVLSLPTHPFVTEQDIERIVQSIKKQSTSSHYDKTT